MGTAAFLQAGSRSWRLFLACLGLSLGASLGAYVVMRQGAYEAVAAAMENPDAAASILSARPDDPKITALAIVAAAGAITAVGVVAGAILGRWLSPGKAGGATFCGGYLLVNLLYFSFATGY